MSFRIENRRRDAMYGRPVENAKVDTSELADKVCCCFYIDRCVWDMGADFCGACEGTFF